VRKEIDHFPRVFLAAGDSVEDILAAFPALKIEDVQAATAFR
jgi:uncharacterized protein (DUF433 family)